MEVSTAIPPDRNAERFNHPWLEALVTALDDRLRLRIGVFEYSRNPACLFRIQIVTSADDVALSDGVTVHAGDRVVNLHVWNEQFPRFLRHRPTLAWARRVDRAFDISLRELSDYLAARPDLGDVVAICGNMGFSPAARSKQLARYVGRFGFERVAAPRAASLRQHMHLFGENILISMMVLARNAAALRADTLRRDRTLVFMSRWTLQRRYGSARERAA
jgi:YkoP domain